MDLRTVALSEIDPGDSTFEIPAFSDSNRLRDSLGCFGILDPVWLLEKSGGYILVDGFQRLCWAKENRAEGVACRIFVQGSDPRDLWMRRIEKKIFEGEINPAQKARIIAVLSGLFGAGEIPGSVLSSLKVARRPEALRKWVLLSKKGREMLESLASGELSERAALEIADWEGGSADSLMSILRALRCSASIQVEIVERITEIAVREDKTRAEVIEAERVREIMTSEELNHREKTQALREYLAELRNPRLSSRRKRFEQDVEALRLPRGARIVAPEAFEGGGWRMELSFNHPEELRKVLREARTLADSDLFDEIFEKK